MGPAQADGLLLGLLLRAAVQGDQVDLGVQHIIQQEVGPQLGGLHDGHQIQNRPHPQAAAGGGHLHGAVGLGGAVADHGVAAPGPGLPQHILQLADLVAAEQAHAGQIVPFEPEVHAQLPGQVFRPVEGGGEKAQCRPGQGGQAGVYLRGGLHRDPSCIVL